MALEAYAVFQNGAYFLGPMTICVAGLWLMLFIVVNVRREDHPIDWSLDIMVPLAIMAAFWLWNVLSLLWSITPDLTWIEINRTGAYLAVLTLGIIAGRSGFSRPLASYLFLMLAGASAAYGLGPKVLPSVIDNLDDLARISVPLGYANAQGLMVALAFPLSLFFSASRKYHWALRCVSALIGPLLLVCLFFTISRGAMLALLFGLLIYFATVPLRLRSFGLLLLDLLPAVLISWWSAGQPSLMLNKADLALRMETAATLRLYIALALVFAAASLAKALIVAKYVTFPRPFAQALGAAIAALLAAALVGSGVWFVASQDDLGGYFKDTYGTFTMGKPSQPGAARLLEMGSSGRWMLWQEAIDNWEENELTGTGAQSFPLVHLMRRESGVSYVKQPHGFPFRLITELGVAGFMLGVSFIMVSLTVCMRIVFRIPDRWDRALAGTLVSMLVIYLIHTSFDWDWNMMALTMAFFFFTGLLLGWNNRLTRARSEGH